MPVIKFGEQNPLVDGRQSETAYSIQRGMVRQLQKEGYAVLTELPLANGRRPDLIALNKKGLVTIIEIKSSIEDFKVDQKWHEYEGHCDRFFFATNPNVPIEIFPEQKGLYVADSFGAELIRDCEQLKLAPASRKAITLRFARMAAKRVETISQYALNQGIDLPVEIID